MATSLRAAAAQALTNTSQPVNTWDKRSNWVSTTHHKSGHCALTSWSSWPPRYQAWRTQSSCRSWRPPCGTGPRWTLRQTSSKWIFIYFFIPNIQCFRRVSWLSRTDFLLALRSSSGSEWASWRCTSFLWLAVPPSRSSWESYRAAAPRLRWRQTQSCHNAELGPNAAGVTQQQLLAPGRQVALAGRAPCVVSVSLRS